MKNLGLIEFYQLNKQTPVYIRRTDIQLLKHPLISYEYAITGMDSDFTESRYSKPIIVRAGIR